MRIIAVASGKGGTGKTTVAVNLAAALCKLGFRTAVIDANFSAPDVATYFGIYPEVGMIDVLTKNLPLTEVLHEHRCGLHIYPGRAVEKVPPEAYKKLKRRIRKLKYDFLVIDTPPGMTEETKGAIAAAKEIIAVATPDWASLSNAYTTLKFAERRGKKILGITINRSMASELEPPPEIISAITGYKILGLLPEDKFVRRSWLIQAPVVIVYPEAKFSKEIMRIAGYISGIGGKRPTGGILAKLRELLGL